MSTIYTGYKVLKREGDSVRLSMKAMVDAGNEITISLSYDIAKKKTSQVTRTIEMGPAVDRLLILSATPSKAETIARRHGFTLTAERIKEVQSYAVKAMVEYFVENEARAERFERAEKFKSELKELLSKYGLGLSLAGGSDYGEPFSAQLDIMDSKTGNALATIGSISDSDTEAEISL